MTPAPAAEREAWDVVVVGSGAAGLAAACKAAMDGARVVVLEHSTVVGGTTAISGGMIWVPGNSKAADAGKPDRLEDAKAYLDAVLPPSDRSLLNRYLDHVEEAVNDFERHTALRTQPVLNYPDYYPTLPGASEGGRVLEPVPFDGSQLGPNFKLLRGPLREYMLFGRMMVSRQDMPHFLNAAKSVKSLLRVFRLLAAYCRQRSSQERGTSLYLGNALVARLFKSASDLGVSVRTECSVCGLLQRDGLVVGVVAQGPTGQLRDIAAPRGVILATGGMSHDWDLRQHYMPRPAGTLSAAVAPGTAMSGARLASEVGGALSAPTQKGAFWVPVSIFRRTDASRALYPHTVTDRSKPGLIAVDGRGRRFVNEAASYHEFVSAQLKHHDTAIPAWLVCDSRFLHRYGLGKVKPLQLSTRSERRSGYLKRASSLEALAELISVPVAVLCETVEDFNARAREGVDPEFGRGSDIYQRFLGDAQHQPNPCVGPIERAPFYAVAVWPADLGMSAGIRVDGQSRVLRTDGTPIDGLFACGADMASVMEGTYPGPGIAIGPAITFGWLAGRAAAARRLDTVA